jgi:uncharacterized phage protein (TIGR02218 family)
MRSVTQAWKDFAAANNITCRCYLYTLTDSTGAVLFRWTDSAPEDGDLQVGGNWFRSIHNPQDTASAPIIKPWRLSDSGNGSVPTIDLTLAGVFSIGGYRTLGAAAAAKWFDGIRVKVEDLIMPTWGDVSLGTRWVFEGTVADAHGSSTEVALVVKGEPDKLNLPVPRRVYQPSCPFALYDASCGLNKAANTLSARTVLAAPTPTRWGFAGTSIAMPDASFAQGWVRFTSGALAGGTYPVSSFTGATSFFGFSLPLPQAPAAGDAFDAVAGCDKRLTTCTTRFANQARFGGMPFAPPPEVR